MKLPGIEYKKGVPSFGREGVGGALRIGAAMAGAAGAWSDELMAAAYRERGRETTKFWDEMEAAQQKINADIATKSQVDTTELDALEIDVPTTPEQDANLIRPDSVPMWEVETPYWESKMNGAYKAASAGLSEGARRDIEAKWQGYMNKSRDGVIKDQIERHRRASEAQFEEGYTNAMNAGQAARARELVDQAEASRTITPAQAGKARREIPLRIESDQYRQTLLTDDIGLMAAQEANLRSEEYAGAFSNIETRLQWANRLRVRREQVEGKKEKQNIDYIKEGIRELEVGVDNAGPLRVAASTIEDETTRGRVLHAIDVAEVTGNAAKAIEGTSLFEDRAILEQAERDMMTPGEGDVDIARVKATQQAFKNKYARVKDDSVAYVQDSSPAIRQLMQQRAMASQQMREQNNDPVSKQNYLRVSRDYFEELETQQLRLGVLPQNVNYLSNNEVTAHGQAFLNASTQRKGDMLVVLAEEYGDRWPQVQRQLVREEVLSGSDEVISSMAGPSQRMGREETVKALAKDRNDQIAALGDRYNARDVKAAITDSFALFFDAILENDVDGRVTKNFHTAAEALVLDYMRGGMDVNDAAEKAAERLLYTAYHREMLEGDTGWGSVNPRGILVPKSAVTDPSRVAQGLEQLRAFAFEIDYAKPPSYILGMREEDAAQFSDDALSRGAYFTSNADQSGAAMMWSNGLPVMTYDDNDNLVNLTFTWDEIEEAATGYVPALRAWENFGGVGAPR